MGNPPELYYKVLNIAKDTPPQEIRAAYRVLVRQWHPDKHPPESKPEAEARFKAITHAYEALLDQQENRAVLRTRNDVDDEVRSCARAGNVAGASATARAPGSEKAAARARTSAAPPPPRTPPARESQKVYSSTNIGGSGRRAFAEFSSYVVRKAPPLERKVECTLEELCAGCKKEVSYTRDVATRNGLIAKKEVTQTIRVKPGWKKGTKVTFEGMGNERPGCLPGDAVFTVSARKHKAFKRQGDDLVLKAEVPRVVLLVPAAGRREGVLVVPRRGHRPWLREGGQGRRHACRRRQEGSTGGPTGEVRRGVPQEPHRRAAEGPR